MVKGEAVEAFDSEALNRDNLGRRLHDSEVDARAAALVGQLSTEDKLAQMHGASIVPHRDLYETVADPVSGLPPFRMVDGPRGVRAGIATTFPVAMARGATWDPDLECRIGEAIALEARAHGANVLLAPAVNLLRHPGWGRAQETYGEDPLHVGRMGVAFTAGAQRHLVASVKHFALNSIENSRFEVDVQADARSLREVYLPHFEACVREAHVGSVMSAYNRVNGLYCAESGPLLTDILKGEWGFRGFVESDWILGTRSTVPSLRAGLDLEMPQGSFYGAKLARALARGQADPALVDEAVRRMLRVKLAFGFDRMREVPSSVLESTRHTALALEAAHKSMVLLKNEGGLLPLDPVRTRRLALVGSLAVAESTGDHGSSAVTSTYVVTPRDGLCDFLGAARVDLVPRDVLDPADERAIARADAAVVVVGLTYLEEGENIPFVEGGGDRERLRLPPLHEALVRRVSALNPRTVVVVQAGSAVELWPWLPSVPAALFGFYAGMLGGEALADLLFGRVAPSGRLPFVMARSEDLPPFDPRALSARYGLEHGHRWLLARRRSPERPFGFGLSYGEVAYRRMAVTRSDGPGGLALTVDVEVESRAPRRLDEVVQLYVDGPCVARRLVGFGRLSVGAGEVRTLRLSVPTRQLAHWDERQGAFAVAPGRYTLRAGPTSLASPLSEALHVAG